MIDRVMQEQDIVEVADRNTGDFLLGGILGSDAIIEDLGDCVLIRLDGVEVPKGEAGFAFAFGVMAAALKNKKEGGATV